MTHQSRMLLIIAVFSVGGLSVLMYMANRYSEALEEHVDSTATNSTASAAVREPGWKREATARALTRVDQFIGVRGRLHAEIHRRGGAMSGREEFDDLRASVLNESGMKLSDYGRVRDNLRSWRDGRLPEGNAMAAAFDQRRDALQRLDLGELEALDS